MPDLPEECFVDYDPEEERSSGEEFESALSAEETAKILAGFVDEMLDTEGKLRTSAANGGRPYEFRMQQLVMARRVAAALAVRRNLCVEAPTGVGKSFAYLIPAIRYALLATRPVVVTTETINLQEQLIEKDIPLLKKISGLEFTACLAKGRSNYLCRRRLKMLTDDRREQLLPRASSMLDLERVEHWSEKSPDGDPDSGDFQVDPAIWNLVCSESGNCLGTRCEFFRRCFYFQARQRWEKSNLVVANHALFLTDLKMRQEEDLASALLPAYSAVIVDEAHTLEDNAAEHLGLAVPQLGFLGWLNRLFSPDSARGMLMRKGDAELELRGIVAGLRSEARAFFRNFSEFVGNSSERMRRVDQPNCFPDTLTEPLGKLRNKLRDLAQSLEGDDDEKSYRCEVEAQQMRCEAMIDMISYFLTMNIPECVYWVELNSGDAVELRAAPVNVAALLKRYLFDSPMPVVLTSATLAVEKSFSFYLNRVGFENGETLQLDSPFDPSKVTLYLPREMPEPASPEYSQVLPQKIVDAVRVTGGKAFVLFTSYTAMRECAEELRGFFTDAGILQLVQGDELRRFAMLKKFKEDINSVLFGVDSFWTGVDVPGESLSNVIVTKLPFAVPSHPLIQARCEILESQKINSFMSYSLPCAVLKLRQGVGRLIRSQSDSGCVFILDRRVVSKRYGKIFLNSLPPYPVVYF